MVRTYVSTPGIDEHPRRDKTSQLVTSHSSRGRCAARCWRRRGDGALDGNGTGAGANLRGCAWVCSDARKGRSLAAQLYCFLFGPLSLARNRRSSSSSISPMAGESLLSVRCISLTFLAIYAVYTSPTHPPVPNHLPTLIVTPHGTPPAACQPFY